MQRSSVSFDIEKYVLMKSRDQIKMQILGSADIRKIWGQLSKKTLWFDIQILSGKNSKYV